jgi:hypothetical protein
MLLQRLRPRDRWKRVHWCEGVEMRKAEMRQSFRGEVTYLIAVIQWCQVHDVAVRDVVEGRRPDVFNDPDFPPVTGHLGRCPVRRPPL